jgi:hypothetical protein
MMIPIEHPIHLDIDIEIADLVNINQVPMMVMIIRSCCFRGIYKELILFAQVIKQIFIFFSLETFTTSFVATVTVVFAVL